jgi:small subunit ribosomal protein S11
MAEKTTTPTTEADIDKQATATATADVPASTTTAPAPAKRRKAKRTVTHGQVHVLATFNNTIITFTDDKGNVLSASSAGACGFRGSKKGTAYAAQVASEKAAQIAKQQYGMRTADMFIKGIGLGRDAAVRALVGLEFQVESITDVNGVPHGGVRPRKARRV